MLVQSLVFADVLNNTSLNGGCAEEKQQVDLSWGQQQFLHLVCVYLLVLETGLFTPCRHTIKKPLKAAHEADFSMMGDENNCRWWIAVIGGGTARCLFVSETFMRQIKEHSWAMTGDVDVCLKLLNLRCIHKWTRVNQSEELKHNSDCELTNPWKENKKDSRLQK